MSYLPDGQTLASISLNLFGYDEAVTVGALEDMGYLIRPGLADPFWVMVDEQGRQLIDRQTGDVIEYAAKPTADAAALSPSWHCGVTGGM